MIDPAAAFAAIGAFGAVVVRLRLEIDKWTARQGATDGKLSIVEGGEVSYPDAALKGTR